jgi:hypothetical protein
MQYSLPYEAIVSCLLFYKIYIIQNIIQFFIFYIYLYRVLICTHRLSRYDFYFLALNLGFSAPIFFNKFILGNWYSSLMNMRDLARSRSNVASD